MAHALGPFFLVMSLLVAFRAGTHSLHAAWVGRTPARIATVRGPD